ncbi:MAG TPA: N-acetylmuramoyl-L-alanine amidase [Rubrobacteraceae bacterium]|nr:N-acetylmuramoyl-L-alanine amidase [Rubrobacteraceae bacterium]
MKAVESLRVRALLLAAFLTSIVVAAVLAPAAGAQEGGPETGCTGQIVLDPGHGGTDTGTSNSTYGLLEKDQNLDVALRLEALLEGEGHNVCMTRTGDATLSNNDRYTYANTTGAKLLISIHMNGSTNKSIDYTTTLYGKPRKDQELANVMLDALYPALGIPKRAPSQFASGVLLKSDMPAIIAESVFITNDGEGRLLSDGTGVRQQQIAEALRAGIDNYLATR